MAKVIRQDGNLRFITEKHRYYIEALQDEGKFLGWNVSSSSGINHFENGLLHKTFEQAFKAMKSAIKNEEQ